MKLIRKLILLAVILVFTTVLAQGTAQDTDTCGALVQQAMTEVESVCSETGRNQACYGYVSLEATPRLSAVNFEFTRQGDLANVADLETVRLDPLDTANQTWGIVMMKLQASLPETLPGQNVTFLLFGDVEIQNAVDPEGDPALQPMQAFYFHTGITRTECAAAPADGILIQTPEGAGKVNLRANGVDIELGSTAFLRAQEDENLTLSVLEGESYVRSEGKTVVVPDGSDVEVPLEDFQPEGTPGDPEAYDLDFLDELPVDTLPEEIIIDEPSSDEELSEADFESEEIDALDDVEQLENEAFDDGEFADDPEFGDEDFGDTGFEDDTGFSDEGDAPVDEGEPPPDDGGGEADGGE